jgi:hypothetical protein
VGRPAPRGEAGEEHCPSRVPFAGGCARLPRSPTTNQTNCSCFGTLTVPSRNSQRIMILSRLCACAHVDAGEEHGGHGHDAKAT